MLQVRFAEVSRSASTSLGFNFAGTDGTTFFGSLPGVASNENTCSADAAPDIKSISASVAR